MVPSGAGSIAVTAAHFTPGGSSPHVRVVRVRLRQIVARLTALLSKGSPAARTARANASGRIRHANSMRRELRILATAG